MYETMHGFWKSVIADADKDDRVTLSEVTQAFAATFADRARYSEELAPVADRFFDPADGDGDGAISRTEFFYGDDPGSPANHIFGRLA
ncbi:hypothetical protein [Streptomyces sp. KL118A]|uniref:hypothetical protein n=1 Tax=Streptomyces sp. KL118A TaxID=3045153 RepID=UPI00278C7D9D|nr:hypothetical protein [Streptomyces sp. KL118A]